MAGTKKSGRRLRTLADFPGDWEKKILALGDEGKSLMHVYDYVGVSENTFKRIMQGEPDLQDVIERFKVKQKIYWMDLGQDLSNGKNQEGNSSAWRFNMQNRAGWSDKVSTESETTVKVEETAVDLFKTLLDSTKQDAPDSEQD